MATWTPAGPGVGGEPGVGAFDTCRHLQLSRRHANKHRMNWLTLGLHSLGAGGDEHAGGGTQQNRVDQDRVGACLAHDCAVTWYRQSD
jgi:hypothetical protein